MGFALQLTALRYLGFCPNDLQTTPKVGVAYLAQQLEVAPAVLATYGQRDKTRTQHTREVEEYLGFREASSEDLRELGQWLTERALEHDKPTTLLGLAAEKLRKGKIVRPGITRLVKLVASAREKAHIQTYRLLEPVLSEQCCKFLDSLIN